MPVDCMVRSSGGGGWCTYWTPAHRVVGHRQTSIAIFFLPQTRNLTPHCLPSSGWTPRKTSWRRVQNHQTQPHTWVRVWKSNSSHNGVRWVLLLLCEPCAPEALNQGITSKSHWWKARALYNGNTLLLLIKVKSLYFSLVLLSPHPLLCQSSVLRVLKAIATRIRGKSEWMLRSLRIQLETSWSKIRTLTNWATPVIYRQNASNFKW